MLSHLVNAFFRNALTLIWYGNAASMVNQISCGSNKNNSLVQQLTSDAVIEVMILKCSFPVKAYHFEVIIRYLKMHVGLLCGTQVSIEVPFAFRIIPVQAIESTGTQVLEQLLRIMLPRFMAQVC